MRIKSLQLERNELICFIQKPVQFKVHLNIICVLFEVQNNYTSITEVRLVNRHEELQILQLFQKTAYLNI